MVKLVTFAKKLGLTVTAIAAVFSVGCKRSETEPAPSTPPNVTISAPGLPTTAQPKLRTMKLFIGDKEMIAEIASRPDEVQTGMMFRTSMEEKEGMLFVFPRPEQRGFWMKNVSVPLSLAYIDPDGVILEIHDLHPFNENVVASSSDYIQFVLETKQGWFKRQSVEVGTLIRTEKGSLQETFLGTR